MRGDGPELELYIYMISSLVLERRRGLRAELISSTSLEDSLNIHLVALLMHKNKYSYSSYM